MQSLVNVIPPDRYIPCANDNTKVWLEGDNSCVFLNGSTFVFNSVIAAKMYIDYWFDLRARRIREGW